MSTTADIFNDVEQLIVSIDALLKTSTAKEVPNIAKDLGAEAQLNAAIDFFTGLLNQLKTALAKLSGPLIQLDAAVAGLELIADSLQAFGKGEALSEILIFFEIRDNPFQPALNGFNQSIDYLEAGLGLTDSIPSPESLSAIGTQLAELTATLTGLKARPALPTP